MYKPKRNLLRDHGVGGKFSKWMDEMKLDCLPFALHYADEKKNVIMVASSHTTDKTSNTFKLVKQIILHFKPQLVMIEGVKFSKGMSPPIKGYVGECAYAASLVDKYIGLEGSEDDIIKVLSKKYKISDIFGTLALRDHKYSYRTRKESKKQFFSSLDKYLMPYLLRLFPATKWNLEEWFLDAFKKPFKYGSHLEYASPYNGRDSVITQKIAAEISMSRDKFALDAIYKMISKYNTIVIIYGANHAYALKDVLCDTFENPILVRQIL